jgi:hypothetical protein
VSLGITISGRAGHGSVRAGFGPFGHPTRDPRVWNFSIRKSQEKMKNRRVFGRLGSGFFGRVGRAGRAFLGDFQKREI